MLLQFSATAGLVSSCADLVQNRIVAAGLWKKHTLSRLTDRKCSSQAQNKWTQVSAGMSELRRY